MLQIRVVARILRSRGIANLRTKSIPSEGTWRLLSTKKEESESLEQTLNRMKGKEHNAESTSSDDATDSKTKDEGGSSEATSAFFSKASTAFSSFSSAVGETWEELLNTGKPKDINKKIGTPKSEAYTGPLDLMVIDESENLTAWERMQRRLTDAPIIQDVLERADELYETSGARKAKERVDDLRQDAREAWETSQNPWVYRISSVYDTLTAESEYTVALRELRELDPDFSLETWRLDVVEYTLPQIMKLFLEGKIEELHPWLGESVYKRLAAEIAARKKEGVQIDTHVLGIMNSEIVACEPDTHNHGSPIILLHYMCQQINCVRKKDDDTIVEGAEDDIRANSYVAAFQREYDEENGELVWKIVDFRFNGAIAYI